MYLGESVDGVNLNEVRKRMESQGNISFGIEYRPAENKPGTLLSSSHVCFSVYGGND
jgi:hypothetical protein